MLVSGARRREDSCTNAEKTAGRKYINYEIDQSIARGNGIVAVQLHHLKNQNGDTDDPGATPSKIKANGYKAYKYTTHERLAACGESRSY